MTDETAARVRAAALAARHAGKSLAVLPDPTRSALLRSLAHALEQPATIGELLAANHADLEAAHADELAPALLARLGLSASKLAGLAEGLRQLADMPGLVGRVQLRRELDEGLILERVACPLGVLGVVFEARPDAVVQIAGLALASGNAVLLKGGAEAMHSNRALVAAIHRVLAEHHVDPACVALLDDRPAFRALLELDELVDLIVARGSGEFVRGVMATTRIPVLGHAEGLCHLYLHADADPEQAAAIALDGKCSYPAACNATETLLWHRDAEPAATACLRALAERGVELRGDDDSLALAGSLGLTMLAAIPGDWDTEYGELNLSVRRVDDLAAALDHIERHGSRHTEAIVCRDLAIGERFVQGIDAACVFVNASTRFADGQRFGLGAEVGISTSKLHARGPVGVEGLLSYRWVLRGSGQVSEAYGPGKRAFVHRDLPLDE
ncbi:glutamate-5-semialdehyde dehydrogenase [Nannocystaceae bacterium ST9]